MRIEEFYPVFTAILFFGTWYILEWLDERSTRLVSSAGVLSRDATGGVGLDVVPGGKV